MTHNEAIATRCVQLSGGYVHPHKLAEAFWVIKQDGRGKRSFSLPRHLIDNEQVRLLEQEIRRPA